MVWATELLHARLQSADKLGVLLLSGTALYVSQCRDSNDFCFFFLAGPNRATHRRDLY